MAKGFNKEGLARMLALVMFRIEQTNTPSTRNKSFEFIHAMAVDTLAMIDTMAETSRECGECKADDTERPIN